MSLFREIEHVPEKEKQEMVDMYLSIHACFSNQTFLLLTLLDLHSKSDIRRRAFQRKKLEKLLISSGHTRVPQSSLTHLLMLTFFRMLP
jgi:hypothetical protein